MKTIGIIGGMGPEATVDLYAKIIQLTPVSKDQEHLHVIIDGYAQIPDRTACILGMSDQDPAPFLIQAALTLETAGADVLCMPCNTAHHFLSKVSQHVSIPFISMMDCVVNKLKQMPQKPQKVFVMATTGTRAAKVYEAKLLENGFEVLPLPEDVQKDLMTCIYEGVKQGKTMQFVPLYQSILDRLSTLGSDALIAACTELPLLQAHVKTQTPVIDATFELAKACVEFGLERKL
ncbi:MAG: aspartate/glutamate racemase family protein [Saezia sp.]